MAIKLIANYSKRLGLPGYSSHQFSVSVETEIAGGGDVSVEAERLYHVLQSSVDEQILSTGFVPPADYGMEPAGEPAPGRPADSAANWKSSPAWKCSARQRELILNLVEEHQLEKTAVEALAVERFGKGVRLLNKVEASGLIDELLEAHGGGVRQTTSRRGGNAYSRANGRRVA